MIWLSRLLHLLTYGYRRRSVHLVTDEWLTAQLRSECGQGWEGPRWRLPDEIKEMRGKA